MSKLDELEPGQLHPDAKAMAKRNYAYTVRNSDGGYEIAFPELPGCATYGDTLEEALSNVEEAKLVWISAMLKSGFAVPPPRDNIDFSGRLLLRCSSGLHRALSDLAALEEVSLNQYVVQALSEKVGSEQTRKLYQRALDDLKAMTFRAEVVGYWAPLELDVSMGVARGPNMLREVA